MSFQSSSPCRRAGAEAAVEPLHSPRPRGWGSVLAEAQLEWYGLPFDFVDVGDLFEDPTARRELAKINPLGQVPALILPDGEVMTETAAITLHLADAAGSHELVPAPR